MSKTRIVFLPYKLHFRHFLSALAERMPVTVMLPPEKSLPEVTKLHGVPIRYSEFGTHLLKPFFRGKRTIKYVKDLSGLFGTLDFNVLITCEYYHWYTLQCIAYKKRHPGLKLYVISETKRWPRNLVAYVFKRVLLFYFKLNIKHIDGVYVYTDAAKDFLKEQLPGMEVSLLPAPVDVQVFKPNATKQFCPNGELRLLMNARFSLYKRHKDLFAALMILHRENKRVRVTCISRNEWDREQIAALAVEKGVQDMVSVLDAQPQTEMPALYYAHDVLVLPSYNEAIGMVVPEAMACGVPTITSDTVGANVYVKHGETGLIFETGNVTALADSIRRCFDTELLEKYGWNASAYIQTTFTPQMVVQRFTESLSSGSELIDDQ